ncbi:D-alanyl-D-alanine carboxypeptidase [Synechocystis sp. LKSZ1]|uniref:D-alanyl-D-alanine carboxypeptidase n=1 Tax=Synechocystis sp. LKSZ1 TaxID=3144951 RepID=UPI00336BE968
MFTLLPSLLGFFFWFASPAPLSGTAIQWQEAKLFDLPTETDPVVTNLIEDYLDRLEAKGYDRQRQGIWFQSEWAYLAHNQEAVAISAASLTKIATSLAVINRWGPEHRFETRFYSTGPVVAGVLQGDLIIQGGFDPLFVWEEAIAVGNALNRQGIKQIRGNLVITGNFAMNFKTDPQIAGALFQQALQAQRWSPLIKKQYANLPAGTPKPDVTLEGQVLTQAQLPAEAQPLLRRQSLSLAQIVKQMNIYSNNDIAEILAQSLGGAAVVAQEASRLAKIAPGEIQLKNGSGLAVENRLSPRAVTQLYQALQGLLKPQGLTLADLFPVMGRNHKGTLEWRALPPGLIVKTGTLNQVSALAGIIPTQERGIVWFTVINGGPHFDRLRAEQDRLLQRLAEHWHILATDLNPGPTDQVSLGSPDRTLIP